MSIKTKMFLIVFALFGVLGSVNFFIQRLIVFPSFLELEEQEAAENLRRITHAFDREITHLDRLCGDWAIWDDAYEFIISRSDDFTASNLGDATLDGAQLNLLALCDIRGDLIWSQALDLPSGKPLSLAMITGKYLPLNSPLLAEAARNGTGKGAVSTELGPLLFATREILRTDGSGPRRGFVIMGRLVNEELLVSLRDQIRIPFEIFYPFTSKPEECDLRLREQTKNDALSFFLLRESELGRTCSSYPDVAGNPLFGIQYWVPRDITRKGQDNVRYAAGLIVGSGVLMLGILLVLLQMVVIRPLHMLTRHTAMLEKDGDFSRRLELNRSDEIGVMATSFDALVRTLCERTEQLEHANQQLTRISTLDGLTGIANRRKFDSHLRQEWRRAMRERQPLSIVLLDVDHFKKYNDWYGHQQGDRCLIDIAATLQQCMQRPTDLAARYGGEEFAAILPNTGSTGAVFMAEKIRQSIRDLHIEHAAINAHVTVSLGVATMVPSVEKGDYGLSELVDAADQALYHAKARGRNRTVHDVPDRDADD